MNIQISIDGKSVVNIEVEADSLIQLITKANQTVPETRLPPAPGGARSAPLSVNQAREILSRVDPVSAEFLRELAANGGRLTWRRMKEIFEIDDWIAFSASYGKGITRVLRFVVRDKAARLIWWDDDEWDDEDDDADCNSVFIDGSALESIAIATGSKK